MDLDILCRCDVNAVDESDLVWIVLHDDRTRTGAITEEAHAAHQRAVGHAGRGEDNAPAWREIARAVHLLEISDAHRPAPFFILRLADDKAGDDFAVQAAHGGR